MEPITGHKGHSHDTESLSDLKLFVAIGINVGLTVVQVIGGLVSGSLSLIADALHNLSDAGALGIALLARVIGRKPPDVRRSFGYRRAEAMSAVARASRDTGGDDLQQLITQGLKELSA